jgi:hypothetical protein
MRSNPLNRVIFRNKPLITSVSPSGHRISTPQPDPGFFRATKVGRCSDIRRVCARDGAVQGSYPATISFVTGGAPVDRTAPARSAGPSQPQIQDSPAGFLESWRGYPNPCGCKLKQECEKGGRFDNGAS